MKWFSIVLGVDLEIDASSADDAAAMVVGAVGISREEDTAAVLETKGIVLETWRNELDAATAESETEFCWPALLIGAVEVSGRDDSAVALETEGTVVEIGPKDVAVAIPESEPGFCWLALLIGAVSVGDRDDVAVALETS